MKKAIIVIDVIDVKTEKDEEVKKLKSEIYVESKDKITKHPEVLEDVDLSLIMSRSEAAAVEAMGGKKEDNDVVSINLSSNVVSIVLSNELKSFKDGVIFQVNRLKESVKDSADIMEYTDEQKSFATAFEKAADCIVSKI